VHFTTLPENLIALNADVALTEVKNNLLGFNDILNSFPLTSLDSGKQLIVCNMAFEPWTIYGNDIRFTFQ